MFFFILALISGGVQFLCRRGWTGRDSLGCCPARSTTTRAAHCRSLVAAPCGIDTSELSGRTILTSLTPRLACLWHRIRCQYGFADSATGTQAFPASSAGKLDKRESLPFHSDLRAEALHHPMVDIPEHIGTDFRSRVVISGNDLHSGHSQQPF